MKRRHALGNLRLQKEEVGGIFVDWLDVISCAKGSMNKCIHVCGDVENCGA
jgi:hypothetical protein